MTCIYKQKTTSLQIALICDVKSQHVKLHKLWHILQPSKSERKIQEGYMNNKCAITNISNKIN